MVIYSDYPAEHKCKALGLSGIPCFDSTAPSIDVLKPDPKGIEVILREMGVTDRRKAVMIGARQGRDRLPDPEEVRPAPKKAVS